MGRELRLKAVEGRAYPANPDGRTLVLTPDGAPWAPRPRVDNAMVKALARAFRWRRMLEPECTRRSRTWPGRERRAVLCERVLRLTLLAPEIVEAILDGGKPVELQLDDLLKGLPLDWAQQANLRRR